MTVKGKDTLPIKAFKSSREWVEWLSRNHAVSKGLWIRIFKKNTGIASVNYAESLEAAISYGWIDSQKKKHDESSWIQKYTPRRPRSVWSKRNTLIATRLIKTGKMTPAGLRQIERAKVDGRWERAYSSPSVMKVPADFIERISRDKKIKSFFETLNKANVYAIAWRLETAKKTETRERRMNIIIEMLARGEKFH